MNGNQIKTFNVIEISTVSLSFEDSSVSSASVVMTIIIVVEVTNIFK